MDIGSGLDVGGGLSTGSESPTSGQLTLGNEFAKEPLKVARLFVRLRYGDWLALLAGKVPVQFRNRRLIWDRDVSPEGATQALQLGCVEGVEARVALGEYMLLELKDDVADPWVLVAQAGVAMRRGPVDVEIDIAAHDYRNVTGVVLAYANGSNTVDADGRLVGAYRLVDWLVDVSVRTSLARLRGYVEIARNVRKARARDAFAIGLDVDARRFRGRYELRRVERDAILDALAEGSWYVRPTGFLGHKLRVRRRFGEAGWTVGVGLTWMRSIHTPADAHVEGVLDGQWEL